MSTAIIEEFKTYLSKDLAAQYNIAPQEANKIVRKSAINRLLRKSPDYVLHVPIDAWVEDIWNEHYGLPIG